MEYTGKTFSIPSKMPRSLGFLPPPTLKECPEQFLGGTLPVQITRPLGDWFNVKITGEVQSFRLFDAMSCVSGAETNSEEKQIENFRENGVRIDGVEYIIDEDKIKDWLDENGRVNLSERFLARTSGTTKTGNNPMKVLDTRDDYGLPPESMWPLKPFIENAFNWNEYYKTIPQAVVDKAKIWEEYFKTRYERITDVSHENFRFVLKQCPIFWATATCSGWQTSPIVQSCTGTPNHMTICEGLEWLKYKWDYDTYNPFDKKLAWNYPVYYPYKFIVQPTMLILKKKGENIMPTLQRKKGTQEVFISLGNKRYWIKSETDFEALRQSQPLKDIEWSNINEVEIFTEPFEGDIIGQATFADLLKKLFGGVK